MTIRTIDHSDLWNDFRPMTLRTTDLSDFWPFGPVHDFRTNEPSDQRPFGISSCPHKRMLNSKPFKFTPHCNCLIPTAMSCKYIENKVGESTSPCFTPYVILNQSVQLLFTRTQADELQYIDLMASYNFPYTSNWDINLYNNRSRFTQSNAFLISIKAQ